MTPALSMPGGSEWIIIIFVLLFLLAMPVLAIVFYLKSCDLRRQLDVVTREKNALLANLLQKNNS
jgi:hypothetical protein